MCIPPSFSLLPHACIHTSILRWLCAQRRAGVVHYVDASQECAPASTALPSEGLLYVEIAGSDGRPACKTGAGGDEDVLLGDAYGKDSSPEACTKPDSIR